MKEWQERFVRRGLDLSSNEAFIASLRRVGYATDPRHSLKVKNTFHNYFDSYSKEEQAKELLIATL